MDVRTLPEWQTLLDRAIARPGTVLVLGASDSGKSTLCRWLLVALAEAGRPGLLLDADVGQSASGLPAAVSLSQVRPDGSLLRRQSFFVGATTPQGHVPAHLAAVTEAMRAAQGAERLVVDTTGLVHGAEAWQLKLRKAQILRPVVIAGVQNDGEVEHLLSPHHGATGVEIVRLPVSPATARRSQEHRRAYRESCFRAALEGATELRFRPGQARLRGMGLGAGRPVEGAELDALSRRLGCEVCHAEASREALVLVLQGVICVTDLGQAREEFRAGATTTIDQLALTNRLVGIGDAAGGLAAIGVLERIERGGEAVVRARLPSGTEARWIDLGSVRLSPTGDEQT
ncbi:MAG: Clp1/GlmU family protein [Planctomycetota bacterium]